MMRDLSRLLRPASVAVIGGGAWCRSVLEQLDKAGYDGLVWPVHPKGGEIGKNRVYTSLNDLQQAPDAAFVGINRDATIDAVGQLSAMGAGGAVCFASGFAEVGDGSERNAALLAAAGDMPILGPNCYGMINAVDGALLWPDQHGCTRVESGVAILTQSSNIAINLTMQNRGLPIAYVVTCGNQAQTTQAEIAAGLLDDPRVTAIGLHIEGFGDLPAWQALAQKAQARNVPIVVLKVGRSAEAQAATVSHTASLAGEDAGAQALLDRLGFARVDELPVLLETLKLLHVGGPLTGNRIATISCSGGEASLAADMALSTSLVFPPLNPRQTSDLFDALGPRVALANPLDYHTYIWRDVEAMTRAFSAMVDPNLDLTLLIVDFPRSDRCDPSDWDHVVEAAIRTRASTGGRVGMVATLPELMPEDVAQTLIAGGVIPFSGLREALAAADAAQAQMPDAAELLLPGAERQAQTVTEAQAKAELAAFGLPCPKAIPTTRGGIADVAGGLSYPVVLKAVGLAHKSDAGGVVLGLTSPDDLIEAAGRMPTEDLLIEEMITGTVAELLVGVVRDPAHGFVLTLGAGGVLTELLEDSASVLIPASRDAIEQTLSKLKYRKILGGYRGAAAADVLKIIDAVMAVQAYVLANADRVEEVEVNPLICTQTAAIAADALIRRA
ncbi:CoA-binding protein [Loktanella sp. IMCC34160]|uniref:acetate--CoA ligase family protein n=1 Tax=Loktanella sp. IMCC34160 TaxID=2510646 RepID=UPI00101CA4F9|nr:acetate--CoA ligase family protein [Loktanella sp. IMCC34160]RYG91252.1 CoA-binding protein [Loktanella sp. IMCC34160]